MRIAAILYQSPFNMGGCENFALHFLNELSGRGHEVTLYVPYSAKQKADQGPSVSFSIKAMPWKTTGWLRFAPQVLHAFFARQQALYRYDLWQSFGLYPSAFLTLRLYGNVPQVVRFAGEDIQTYGQIGYGHLLEPASLARARQVLSRIDACIAMTESLKSRALELGASASAIKSVPNAISVERLYAPDSGLAYRHLNDIEDTTVLLTIGRNHPIKGHDIIPKIASKLKGNWRWIVIGTDSEKLWPELTKYGVAERVTLLPPVFPVVGPDGHLELPPGGLVELMNAADIFVHPSRMEGFSRAIAEAMGAGLPVVTTNASGCGELITPEHGLVADVDDVNMFAEHLNRLITDQEIRTVMGDNARAYAQGLSWQRVTSMYEAVYNELVS